MTEKYYFRLDSSRVSDGVDEWDNPVGPGHVEIYVSKFLIIKETPKGVWISIFCGEKKFVLSDPKGKRYAYATLEDAKKSFALRKKRYIQILSGRIRDAEEALYRLETKFLNGL
jgi:hypothetical protein